MSRSSSTTSKDGLGGLHDPSQSTNDITQSFTKGMAFGAVPELPLPVNEKQKQLNVPAENTATELSDTDKVDPVSTDDYSVFTVGQKRAIIVAGSFAGWFRWVDSGTCHQV
jgi:hypothetical protein